jgi:ubiquinone/menaquinone biosynthesis C-methylase UbiE
MTDLTLVARERVRELMPVEGDLCFRRRCETIVEFLDAQADDLLLDCGCGYGFTLGVLSKLTEAQLVGLDLSAERVREVQKRFPTDRTSVVQGSGMSLPFATGSFGKAVCSEVLEHLPDDKAALSELFRVLKPGGTLVVTVPAARYPAGWDPVNYVLERTTGRHIGGERTLSGIWYGHLRLYTPEQLHTAAEQAGFEVEEIRPLTHFVPPFNHLVMYGILKPLLMSGRLPGNLSKAGNRFNGDVSPKGPVALAGRLLNALDRKNDDPDLPSKVDSFVALALKARRA